MKKIFLLLNVLVLCYLVQAQPGRWNRNSTPFEFVWQITDSMNRIPLDTLTNAADGSIAMKNHGLWFKDTIWKKVAYLTDVTGGGGGGGVWGGITGTLSNQGDLQSALDLKLRIADTSGMLSAYVRSIGNLSPLFTASIASHGISFSLSDASSYTVFGRGTGTGAPSYISSLDSNWIPALHTQAYYDARYIQNPVGGGGGTFNFTDGLQQLGNNVVALHDLGLWNARKFQGFDIQPGSPSDGDFYVFRQSCNCYDFTNIDDVGGGGGGGGGGGSITSFLNVDTTYRRLATVVDSSNAVLKSIRLMNGSEIVPTETDSTMDWDLSTILSGFSLDLQTVTDAGNTTANAIFSFLGFATSGSLGFNVQTGLGASLAQLGKNSLGGYIFLDNNPTGEGVWIKQQQAKVTNDSLYLPNTGNAMDTLATLDDLRGVSDERLKSIQGYYHGGLSEILKINPIVYKWNDKTRFDQNIDNVGFSAQNIKSVIGDKAVGTNQKGYLTIQDRAILATLVNAIKDQQEEIDALQKEIIQLKKQIEEIKSKK